MHIIVKGEISPSALYILLLYKGQIKLEARTANRRRNPGKERLSLGVLQGGLALHLLQGLKEERSHGPAVKMPKVCCMSEWLWVYERLQSLPANVPVR